MTDPATESRVTELEQQLAQVQSELHALRGPAPAAVSTDLSQLLGADQADRVRAALGQLGQLHLSGQLAPDVRDRLSGLFGGALGSPPAVPTEPLARLAEPPRHVPFAYRVAAFSWSSYEMFGIFMGLVAPIALWGLVPASIPAGFIAAVLVIAVIRVRLNARRWALLKWGKVATVGNADETDRGTYYSGMTYNNMIVPQAHGWDVDRGMYNGPGSVTSIAYTLDGTSGVLRLRGRPYAGGVILADSRRPAVALCVSSFPYAVKPGPDGELVGHLRVRSWVGIVLTLLVHATLVAGAVATAVLIW